MKLSIIVPVYKKEGALAQFIKKISEQTIKSFELVLVIDTNNENVLSIIDKFKGSLKNKLKIVFNSKRVGRTEAVNAGAKVAIGTNSIILSTSDTFQSTLVFNVLKIINEKKADIIEFNATFKKPLKFIGKVRKLVNKPILINNDPSVVAYTYPFDFNKIFKTSVLQEAAKLNSISHVNSRFSIEHVYKVFLIAKTYSSISKTLIKSRSKIGENFNPLKMIRQWTSFHEFVQYNFENKFEAEFAYARILHEVVFMFGFVGISKNKILLKKLKQNFDKSLKLEFNDFFVNNIYMLLNNNETKVLKGKLTTTKLTKIFRHISN